MSVVAAMRENRGDGARPYLAMLYFPLYIPITSMMGYLMPSFTTTTVLDLVPFGNAGGPPGFYALRLEPPEWTEWRAGQFVMLRLSQDSCTNMGQTLWGRPFSICRLTNRDLVLFFQVVGRATAAMAQLKIGDQVDIWGPLGNEMAVDATGPTLLIGGGIGIAPFVGYIHTHPKPRTLTLEFGHRMPLDCYPYDSLTEYVTAKAHMDTSEETLAEFVAVLDQRIKEHAKGLVLACGPLPMLRTVQALSARHGARTQLCLETRMACGIGACLGCVVKAALDGGNPVYDASLATAPRHHIQTCTCGPNIWADAITL